MNAPEHLTIERAAIEGAIHIPINLLSPSPTNPRKHFDPARLDELATSIKTHSVLQPILVRPIDGAKAGAPLYEIVAGERRWRGSKLAEQPTVPALVRQLTDFEVLEMQVIENLQRDDLSPLEEAEGYHSLLRKPEGLQGYATAEELAHRIGKSRRYVFNRLKLLELVEDGRKAMQEGKLSSSNALLVARLPQHTQKEAVKLILDGWNGEPLTQRAAAEQLERKFMLRLDKAPFKITDASLVPAAGSCRECPKRTGANPDLFDDIKSADTCTDSACFNKKADQHKADMIAAAEATGTKVIAGAEAKKLMPYSWEDPKGFMRLDEPNNRISDKPLSKLLGKDAPATTLLENPHTHELIKVVVEAEAMAVLRAKGIVKTAKVPTSSASGRADVAKAKAATAWRLAAVQQLGQVIEHEVPDAAAFAAFIWPEIAIAMWRSMGNDACRRIQKLMGWESEGASWSESTRAKEEASIRALTRGALGKFISFMCLVGDIHVAEYQLKKEHPVIDRFADQLGVDVQAIRRELAAGVQAKEAGKRATKKVAKRASTPPISAAAQGAKPAPLTPEKALADAVAKDSHAKAASKAKSSTEPKAGKKADQKDKPAAPAAQIVPEAAWPFPKRATS